MNYAYYSIIRFVSVINLNKSILNHSGDYGEFYYDYVWIAKNAFFLNIDWETANQIMTYIYTLPIQIMSMCHLMRSIRVEKKKNWHKQTHEEKTEKK